MKLNCLLTNVSAVNDIKDGLIIEADRIIKEGGKLEFKDAYKMLRNSGLEVDAESAAYIYMEAFGDSMSEKFTPRDEVENYVTADARSKINSIVGSIMGEESEATEKTMGALSEEKRIAKSISSLFEKKYFPRMNQKTESLIVQMGKAVEKALKSKLSKEKAQKVTSLNDALEGFFELEKYEQERLDGGVNNIESIWSASKEELDNNLNEIVSKLPQDEAALVRELWGNYTSQMQDAMYDIMLSSSNQNALLNKALSSVKINDKNVVDKNGDIAWSAISSDLDIDEVVSQIEKAFSDGFKDATGKEVKYTPTQSKRLAEYLGRLLERKVAEFAARQIANERIKEMSAQNVIADFLKDRGLLSLRKDEQGKLSKTVSNWKDLINFLHRKGYANREANIEELKSYFREYVESLTDNNGDKLFTNPQKIDEVVESFGNAIEDKLVPDTLTPNSIDKMIALSRLNGGNSFDEDKQQALNKLIGLSGLDQVTLNKLHRLAGLIQIVSGMDIEGTPFTRGEFAFQAYSQIDRLVKEILSDYRQDKSGTQKVVKTISGMMGATTGSLLLNPKNFVENITSGFGAMVVDFVRLAVSNPKMFKKLMTQGGSDFLSAFASHFFGGAHGNIFAEQDLSVDVAQGERLRLRTLEKMKWNSIPNVLKNIGDSYSIFFNTIMRAFMNSFDSGFNQLLGKMQMYDATYSTLAETWGKDEANRIMDEALSITPKQAKELKEESFVVVEAMRNHGLNPTAFDRRLIEKEMRTSLYREAMMGNFKGNSAQRSLQATKALFSASQLATKELLGKRKTSSQDFLSQWVYRIMTLGMIDFQSSIFKKVKKKELEGELGKAAIAEFSAEIMRNGANKFLGGVANWMILGLGATPFGLMQLNSFKNQIKDIKKKNPNVGNLELMEDTDAFVKYQHLKQMYKHVAAKTLLGSALMAMTAAYLVSGDDDDEYNYIENLLKTKNGRRLLGKEATLGMFVTALALADNSETDFDGVAERLAALGVQLGSAKSSSMERLIEDFKWAKTDDDKAKAIGSLMSNLLPQGNINQVEQVDQFIDELVSGYTGETSDVLTNQAVSKEQYKKMEGFVDGLMGNGMFKSAQRFFSDENYNRYKKD